MSAERFSLFFVNSFSLTVSNKVTENIAEVAKSVITTTDFFLVSVEIKGGDIPEVWISIDAADRDVNMDECAELSNEISFLMDAHDIFSGQYRMNVSSPGLDKPLTDRRQYGKNEGRKVKVTYSRDGEASELEGILQKVTDDSIVVELGDDTKHIVSFDQLRETKIIPTFKK